MFKRIFEFLLVAMLAGPASATVLLSEGFDDVSALAGAGWVQVNASSNPANPYFQGNPGIFPSASGAPNSYVAANFLSGDPTISNWLMSPVLTFTSNLDVDFFARVAGDGFLDTIQVWLSTSGGSTNVADFTTSLGSYSADTDQGWVPQSLGSPTPSGAQGRLGFRYFVDDVTVDGNYIGIDSLTVAAPAAPVAVPEPGSLALLALGLAGLGFSRRKKV